MRLILIYIFMPTIIYGMHKQITPINNTPASVSSSLSDHEVCYSWFSRFWGSKTPDINPEVITHLAQQIRQSSHDPEIIEESQVHEMIIKAVNDALTEKEKQISARISKKHSAYIAIATGILSTTITALATIYNTNHECKS